MKDLRNSEITYILQCTAYVLTINWASKTRHQNQYLYPRLFIEQLAMKYSRIKNYQVLHNIGIFSHFPVLQIRRKLSQRQHALHKSERHVFCKDHVWSEF